jgi:hypothetical protein
MFGALPPLLSEDTINMFLLLMILANSCGFTCLSTNLKFFKKIRISMPMLNVSSIGKCWPNKLTGGYQKLSSFFVRVGITHLVSYPHTHEQNVSAERKHRHIVEVSLALLAYASMPLKF